MPGGLKQALTEAPEPSSRDGALRFVAIGGGTGLPNVLRGLRPLVYGAGSRRSHSAPRERLTAIVTTTDDGGSSGRLRRDFNIIPPGDVRNCLAALAEDQALLAELFQFRFDSGDGLKGHALGNLMLTALNDLTGDVTRAIQIAGRVVGARGTVLPATLHHVSLAAELDGGRTVQGEMAIVSSGSRIRRLSLVPVRPSCSAAAVEAIRRATVIVVGPGSLFTSILPPLLVPELAEAIEESKAARVFVLNLMTEPGETANFSGPEHLKVIADHLGRQPFDYVVFNTAPIPPPLLAEYALKESEPVVMRASDVAAIRRLGALPLGGPLVSEGPQGWIRHHPGRLAAAITACARLGPSRALRAKRGQD